MKYYLLLFGGQKPLFAESTHLYECVDVVHESLSPANNELIHTRYGMRPTERVWISMLFLIIVGLQIYKMINLGSNVIVYKLKHCVLHFEVNMMTF